MKWLRRLVIIIATALLSFLTFVILLLISPPGWESSEYLAIVVWSIPLGLLVVAVSGLERRLLSRRSMLIRVPLLFLLGVVTALVWLIIAVQLTGGYALAFDANPLWCWIIGSVGGMYLAMLWRVRDRPDWSAA